MKKAVVTGPTGAVGVALINELISNDYFVFAICHKSSNRINNIPKSKFVKIIFADLNELLTTENEIENSDVFFHLGWQGTFGDSRNDFSLQNDNIKYALDSVMLANNLHCKSYIGVGSQSEYGPTNTKKYPDGPCFPDNFYGAAKLSASYMTRVLCNKFGIRHNWCRIFSLFGPCDGPYTMIMSSINKMINNEVSKFTKGEQIWDYIYSKDAALAFRLIAEKGINNQIYCIASGEIRKLKDYIISLHDIVNPNSVIEIGAIDYYPHQAMNLSVDITNLKNDTGFMPKYTFEEGIMDLLIEMKLRKD